MTYKIDIDIDVVMDIGYRYRLRGSSILVNRLEEISW